ncbi:OprD family porin [Pseudomonas sp. ICMP 561]|uniref:OprD family porin n=1 Tax=Pseudomonas sp. ICMP 561 TaxID=1718918 RepID=UPI000C078029|nr:OprD family porin [Pseudomonas sp. ICMP 561]PHN17192.1 porin [Pseudomonas sp. ICMP 561]
MDISDRKIWLVLPVVFTCAVQANADGFTEDSKATLTLRNYYFDRDYKGATSQSAAREWAQGGVAKFTSGFTSGPLGFGLDALGMVGLKLDSSPDRSGTGLLPRNPVTRRATDEYSELGLTAKAKVSKTEIQVGSISTFLPIAFASPTRLLPQTFRGTYLRSSDIDDLSLHIGYLDRINLRDSTDYQPMTVASPNRRFLATAESDSFMFAGGDYKLTPSLSLKYYYAVLEDMYQKNYAGFEHVFALGSGKLKTDFRFYKTSEDGAAEAGRVDNKNTGVMFTYSLGSQTFGAGYMRLDGETAMPYLAGTEPLVVSEGFLSSEFLNPKERSWQALYSYDFAGLGVPGLKATTRYIKGTNIELPTLGGAGLTESERYLELSYAFQGSLKGLSIRARHSLYRNDFASAASFRDDNESRLNIDYTMSLW